jgi:hypothetical protein
MEPSGSSGNLYPMTQRVGVEMDIDDTVVESFSLCANEGETLTP